MFKTDNAWHVPTVPFGEFYLVVLGIYRQKDQVRKDSDAYRADRHHTVWPRVSALEVAEYLETETVPDPLAKSEGSSKWKPLVYLRFLQGFAGINPTWAVQDRLGERFASKPGFRSEWSLIRENGDASVIVTYPNKHIDSDSDVYAQRVKDRFSSLKLMQSIDQFSNVDHRSPNAPAFTLQDVRETAYLPMTVSDLLFRLLKRFPLSSPPLSQMVLHYMVVEGLAKGYWDLEHIGIDGIEMRAVSNLP